MKKYIVIFFLVLEVILLPISSYAAMTGFVFNALSYRVERSFFLLVWDVSSVLVIPILIISSLIFSAMFYRRKTYSVALWTSIYPIVYIVLFLLFSSLSLHI